MSNQENHGADRIIELADQQAGRIAGLIGVEDIQHDLANMILRLSASIIDDMAAKLDPEYAAVAMTMAAEIRNEVDRRSEP